MPSEEELIEERIKKIEALKAAGINPYPYAFDQKNKISDLKAAYKDLPPAAKTNQFVSLAGRIIAMRRMGGASFLNLRDEDGDIQLHFRKDITKNYDLLKFLDVGDWLGVEGTIFKTKTDELTVEVNKFEILCKSIRPPPEKWHGLRDIELRYKQRYLDLAYSLEVREVFKKRIKAINAIREFLNSKGFIEVETPILQMVYGGAAAKPFSTRFHALKKEAYLRISPELHHKRLLVGGFEKIYEFAKSFRNEDIDRFHNPEFTLLEAYQAYADYEDMIELIEDIFVDASKAIFGETKFEWRGVELNVAKPWRRYTYYEAIKEFAGIEVEKVSDKELLEAIPNKELLPKAPKRWQLITEIFEQVVQDKLIQPTIITHHPLESTPLCKPCRYHPELFVERFEPFIAGLEIGNAYSELNDPILQKKFLEEQTKMKAHGAHAHPYDEDFVRAIEYGMPPAGGLGLGIDRIIMLLTNQPSIRDVIFFPFVKF